MSIEKRSAFLIIAAGFLWALDLLVRFPITLKLGFVQIVFFESLLGLLFLSPWLIRHGKNELRKFSSTDWLLGIFIGGIGLTVAGYLFTVSIKEATPGTFSFFQIIQPIFVVYGAHLFLKEKVDNLYYYWGLWVILSAVLLFSQDLELMFSTYDLSNLTHDLTLAMSAMIIWGLCTVAGKKLLQNHGPLSVVAVRWIFAFIFSIGFFIYDKAPLKTDEILNLDFILRFVFLSGVAGVIAMYLYYSGLKNLAAGKVSFLELAYPSLGMMFSGLYTFGNISLLQAIGALSFLAFFGLLLSKQGMRSDTRSP